MPLSRISNINAVQDPTLLDRHNIVAFDHVKRDLKLMSDEEKAAQEVRLCSGITQNCTQYRCNLEPYPLGLINCRQPEVAG